MARWKPNAPERLAEAALDLFAARGYEATTVAEIAERAGLTKSTFFRYFADKREVLFGGSALLQERLVAAVAEAPEGCGPLEAVAEGLGAAAALLGEFRRDLSRQRRAVIAANPELRERERAKLADYAAAVAATLRERGVPEPQATLAAEAGMTVLPVALGRWSAGPADCDLPSVVRDVVSELRALIAGG